MVLSDYLTLFLYLIGVFGIGRVFSRRAGDHKEMFAAGRRSPWWAAGLSSFMTMFSAGTFVVWGGIAYRLGFVAVMINTCYGIAALLAGYFVAGKWNQLGVATPAEYVRLRFGVTGLHFFTWTMLLKRLLGVSVSLYSLGILLVALVPLQEGAPFRDPSTGYLSFTWAVIFFGIVVVVYTMLGGLWAVLMTDVLQFIVLTVVVLLVAWLTISLMDGINAYIDAVPPDFFSPVAEGYGWLFLMGWVIIHFFMIGAEWAFVQRFLAVNSPSEARKSSYLFGAMYLVTPIFWLLPPLLYRGINPDAAPEQAYILSAQAVLPPGLLGLMFAAMFSATASMVSSQLNVFAGVLTLDFYKAMLRPKATNSNLVAVGRFFTIFLGALLVTVAVFVPHLGGAEKLIIAVNSLLVVPLFAPTLWGLFSRRIGVQDMWFVALLSFSLGAFLKFGIIGQRWFSSVESFRPFSELIRNHPKNVEVLVGVLLPLIVLTVLEWSRSKTDEGWTALEEQHKVARKTVSAETLETSNDPVPGQIVLASLGGCSVALIALNAASEDKEGIVIVFAVALLLIGLALRSRLSGRQ